MEESLSQTPGVGHHHPSEEEKIVRWDEEENSEAEEKEEEEEDGDDEASTFPRDVFSMMFFANVASFPFLYGVLVFCCQISILLAIYDELLYDEDFRSDEGDRNPLNVPVNVDRWVRAAQVIAILLVAVSNRDVTQSLEMLSLGWKPFLEERFPDATFAKFILANSLRIFEGLCVVFVSYIFILQSSTALDIFLNFAAVEFVASLDDLAYELASEGWLGRSMKHFIVSIEKVRLPAEKKKIDWILFVKPTLVAALLIALYSTFIAYATAQDHGKILKATSCGKVEVKFGSQVYALSEEDSYEFETTSADSPLDISSFFDHYRGNYDDESIDDYIERLEGSFWRIVGSERILAMSFDPKKPPDLHYEYFSGFYYADFDNLESSRPTYYHDDYHDVTSGEFYYCDGEKSWVFTIKAFMATGAIPKHNMGTCKYGWLMRSPITEAFTLDEAPTDGWSAWTGVMEFASDFSVTCTECRTDLDCGTSARGKCRDRQCHCIPGVAEGNFCSQDTACDDLLGLFGESFEFTYPDESAAQHTLRNIRSVLSGDATIHGRPAYYLSRSCQEEVVFYTGRRWYVAYFNPLEMPIAAEDSPEKRVFFKTFHAYWNNVRVVNTQWISEPTDRYIPTGTIQWHKFYESRSMGNFDSFPARYNVPLRLECYSVDCDVFNVCGKNGICTVRDARFEPGGYELVGNECVCRADFRGHFCEYNRNEPPPNSLLYDPTVVITLPSSTSRCSGNDGEIEECGSTLSQLIQPPWCGGAEPTSRTATVASGQPTFAPPSQSPIRQLSAVSTTTAAAAATGTITGTLTQSPSPTTANCFRPRGCST